MKDDLKLRQSNNLILATHKMSIQQMRLFFYACSQYKGSLEIEVSLNEVNRVLTEDTGNRGGTQRDRIRETIPTLMRNAIVHIEDEDGEEWCSALRKSRINKDDTVVFTFDKSIQKELEELRGYTWMYLSNLTGMSSHYAVRMYEFFAMRLGSQNMKGTFDFDLNKLRMFLDCTNKYARFDLFEMRVLKVAKAQINEKTNIKLKYKKIKTGRSVTSIKFSFAWKSKDDVIDVEHTVHDPNDPPAGQQTIYDAGVEDEELTKEKKEAMEMLKEYD